MQPHHPPLSGILVTLRLSAEPRERGSQGDGFRSLSDIPTFKICQIIFLSEELSSKYISISFDVFKYTGFNLQRNGDKYIRLSVRDWYIRKYKKNTLSPYSNPYVSYVFRLNRVKS